MKNLGWLGCLAVMFGAMSQLCFADLIILKNGQDIEGEVVKETDKGLILKLEYGTLLVEKDKILRREKDTPEKIAKRLAAEEKRKKFEAEMRAAGNVEYRGKWISKEEYDAIQEKKKAEREERKQKRLEQKKKREEEEKKRLEEQRKRFEAAQRAAAARRRDWDDDGLTSGRRRISRRGDDNDDRYNKRKSNSRRSKDKQRRKYEEELRRKGDVVRYVGDGVEIGRRR